MQLLARLLKDNSPSLDFPVMAPFVDPVLKASFLSRLTSCPFAKHVLEPAHDCADTLIITLSLFLCFYAINALNTLWVPEQTHKAPLFWITCCPSSPAAGIFHISAGCRKSWNAAPLLLSFRSGGVTSETASALLQSANASQRVFTQSFTSVRQTSSNVSNQCLPPHVQPMNPPPENVRLAQPRSQKKHRTYTSNTNRGRCPSEK